MDVHNRYMNFPVINKSILEVVEHFNKENVWWPWINNLIRVYVLQTADDNMSLEKLETLRTLLCHVYQNNTNVKPVNIPLESVITNISEEDVMCILCALHEENKFQIKTRTTLLLDIFVLHTVLFADIKYIVSCFEAYLSNCMTFTYYRDTESNYIALKTMGSFLDTLRLREFLKTTSVKTHKKQLEKLCPYILQYIESWLVSNDDTECGLLASLLPKLVNIFDFETIVSPLWKMTLNEDCDLKERVKIMCIMADVCFPLDSSSDTNVDCDLYIQDAFWSLLLRNLSSTDLQHRKQAMYLMERAIKFIDIHQAQFDNSRFRSCNIIPFMCKQDGSSNLHMQQMKKNFFLILEALEEKQKHLVMQALKLVESLIDGYTEHESCGNCFNLAWIRCILQRVLQHENNAILKWGVLRALNLDMSIYNDQFLELLVNTLNNTFLYECYGNEDIPEVVNKLAALFIRAEEKKVGLVNRFILMVSEISWGPVAIFYVMKALQMIPESLPVYSVWQYNQLEAIKSLAEMNVNMHNQILRIGSQIGLIGAFTHFVNGSCDLALLANTLSAFPTNEALTYNSMCWHMITSWMKRMITVEDAINFVTETCEKLLNDNAQLNVSIKAFSLMIIFLCEAGLVLDDNPCPAKRAIDVLLCSLMRADVRAYSNTIVNMRCVELMGCLLKFCTLDRCKNIDHMVTPYVDMALKFIFKCLRRSTTLTHCEDVDKYMAVMYVFYEKHAALSDRNLLNHLEKFEEEAIHILQDADLCHNLQRLFGLKILYLCQRINRKNFMYIDILLNTYATQITPSDNKQEGKNVTGLKGKIASDYYKITAQLIHEYLMEVPVEKWPLKVNWLSHISRLFESGKEEVIPAIAGALTEILSKKSCCIFNDLSNFKSLVDSCWKSTLESKRTELYWLTVEKLTKLILNPVFLKIEMTEEIVTEYIEYVINKGDKVPRLKVILLKEMRQVPAYHWQRFQKTVLACLLHGDVPRRDQRIEMHACAFIINNYEEHYAKQIFAVKHYNINAIVRAEAIVLLSRSIVADSQYTSTFLPLVINKLAEYKNKRYFNDSYVHRIKSRIMQIFLIIQPSLNKVTTVALFNLICNLLLTESDQYSVRFMQEWLLIRISLVNKTARDRIWEFYEQGNLKRPSCLSSVISVIYHVSKLISHDDKRSFIATAIFNIVPSCMTQHFNVRLHAQLVLVKLYEMLPQLKLENIKAEYKGVYSAAFESLYYGQLLKNSVKLQEEFYFRTFHPIDDYSLQTIYYELPRLLNLRTDEWIATHFFQMTFKDQINHPIKLRNLNESLSKENVSSQAIKSSDGGLEKDDFKQDFYNIQRKITPWKLITPVDDDLLEMSKVSISHRKIPTIVEGIIVVASLIDYLPNVGGLARTCETFGAKELVIGNIKYTESKEFQNLSVSAEKWITITEVKSDDLQKYLLEKRDLGWTLVGAEQTANSITLSEMKFNKKTVLLLGNEKNGIPANLIALMDVCVEIPQVGIIRSLNVHVTGAICIWQYLSQHGTCT